MWIPVEARTSWLLLGFNYRPISRVHLLTRSTTEKITIKHTTKVTPKVLDSLQDSYRQALSRDDLKAIVDTGSLGIQFIFDGKTAHRLSFAMENTLFFSWKDNIQHQGSLDFNCLSLGKRHVHLIKAVVTMEPKCLVPSENGRKCDPSLQYGSNSDSQVLRSSVDDSLEMDEREKLRRSKISKANKGNVPWNKGKKHSAETLQRIRERTRIAMQDPKVKMKLLNLGHAQSEETRIKIGVGVREGWQRRRERLIVQEGCFFDWQNLIAEASRKGFVGEDELQWDSYKILDDQLKQEWLESVEKRKTTPRPKGSKRAPKSAEQRKKISEAISAKWADPEYRNRVYTALEKYHGTPIGVEKKPRRKRTGGLPSAEGVDTKKPIQPQVITNSVKSIQKNITRKNRRSAPSYKDPMVSYKLEMIKQIRAERAATETKKKEAIERAKLLIAKAEKAANALEVAALKSPLAQASLVETRKLIAEAVRSIEGIENEQSKSKETVDDMSFYNNEKINSIQTDGEVPIWNISSDMLHVNGSPLVSLSNSDYKGFDFNALNERESAFTAKESASTQGYSSPSLQHDNPMTESSCTGLLVDQSKSNGSIRYNLPPSREAGSSQEQEGESHTSVTKTKKWVCGRLVEVEEG